MSGSRVVSGNIHILTADEMGLFKVIEIPSRVKTLGFGRQSRSEEVLGMEMSPYRAGTVAFANK